MRIRQVCLLATLVVAIGHGDAAAAGRTAPRQRAAKRVPKTRRPVPPRRLVRRLGVRRLRPRAAARRRLAGRLPSAHEARRFLAEVVARERRFYQPGVSYDAETGLTFDGHPIDQRSGELRGAPRNWSAASKESLHIVLLAKAVAGDPTARALLTPDPGDPDQAVGRALDVLGKKIATYRRFHQKSPGFGGFLPWFKVAGGELVPMKGWTDRVPGLDNGQLAWSLYLAEAVLREGGHVELADAYRRHLELMADNVVRVFYDPAGGQFRGEAVLARGGAVSPARNRYRTSGYLIEDAYEGLLLVHFADLMGRWRGQAAGGRDAVWRTPRRTPASFRHRGKRITVVEGHWFSSHEDWGFLILPYRDLPVADRLFENAQRARTQFSARRGLSGLFASTHRPVLDGDGRELAYENASGIQEIARDKVRQGAPIFAPYAAFPLALVDQRLFAGWLRSMVDRPGMLGPYGIGESYSEDGGTAPLLTWDGKALPMIAMMGGVSADIGRLLRRDGLYDPFLARVAGDYRLFDSKAIEGEDVPFHAPPPARGAAP
ncbi:MAG TPA: hypothetical protein VFU21_15630 [Kofleriaceae bacterium]|nr:hypothetical protein [Kofleriaceae bacterium]